MALAVAEDALALQKLYYWERTAPDRVVLTQPTGGGNVQDYTWREVLDQTRRMAAHLQALDSRPVLVSHPRQEPGALVDRRLRNLDGRPRFRAAVPTLAAGTVRQILEHSEAQLLFVGKLDAWDEMKAGVPTGLPIVRLPMSAASEGEAWDEIVARTQPLQGNPVRDGDELSTIMYTSARPGCRRA